MLESQRLQIERIKLQKEINRLPEVRTDDPEMETRMKERNSKLDTLFELDEKLIRAMEKEDQEAQAAMARHVNTDGWSAELREFRDLGQRVTIADYVRSVVTERSLDGAAAEYNQHVFGQWHPGEYPLEMLLDRNEQFELPPSMTSGLLAKDEEERTAITGIASTHGNPTFVDRLLATSEAAYLTARFPAVGPGRHSYPIVSGSTVATSYTRVAAETPAGGLTIVDADPERIQHSYEYAAVDELQIPGVAAGLASDLRLSLMAGLDNKVVDQVATNATEGAESEDPITLENFLALWGAAVNGVAARNVSDVRWLLGAVGGNSKISTYASVIATKEANIALAFLSLPHDRVRGSAHIAVTNGSGEQTAIAIRTGSNAPRLLVPVWRRGTLLRDTGRLQLASVVTLTGVMYADVIMVNSDLHVRHLINVD